MAEEFDAYDLGFFFSCVEEVIPSLYSHSDCIFARHVHPFYEYLMKWLKKSQKDDTNIADVFAGLREIHDSCPDNYIGSQHIEKCSDEMHERKILSSWYFVLRLIVSSHNQFRCLPDATRNWFKAILPHVSKFM